MHEFWYISLIFLLCSYRSHSHLWVHCGNRVTIGSIRSTDWRTPLIRVDGIEKIWKFQICTSTQCLITDFKYLESCCWVEWHGCFHSNDTWLAFCISCCRATLQCIYWNFTWFSLYSVVGLFYGIRKCCEKLYTWLYDETAQIHINGPDMSITRLIWRSLCNCNDLQSHWLAPFRRAEILERR